jgi:hypothetical protein
MDILIGDMVVTVSTLERLAQLVQALDEFIGGELRLQLLREPVE